MEKYRNTNSKIKFDKNYYEQYKTLKTKSYFKYSNILKLIKSNDHNLT